MQTALALQPLPPLPAPRQVAWQRAECSLFFHFGVNTFTDREWGDGTEDPAIFNPMRLDCRQWAAAAKAGGFRIAILTAKHHDGFCLWPSRFTDHTVANCPWRNGQGDLVREFVDAFRDVGLEIGLYLSPWDRHEPSYGNSPRYNRFYINQLTELLTQYGPVREVWFDGACGEGPDGKRQVYDWPAFFAKVTELQPEAVTFGDGGTDVRWVGNEQGLAGDPCWSMVDSRLAAHPGAAELAQATGGEAGSKTKHSLHHGDEDGDVWRPAESDVSIRPGWFYHPSENDKVRSVDNLVELYFQSVGRNSLLLLNVPPTPEGLLCETDVQQLAEFRKKLNRLLSKDLAADADVCCTVQAQTTASELCDPDPDTYWAAAGPELPVTIELRLPARRRISVAMLQEPIAFGQRIAAHRLEGMADGRWRVLAEGTTVGHKRLHRFPAAALERVRLTITAARGPVALSRLALFGRP